jgi:hypothetical protein
MKSILKISRKTLIIAYFILFFGFAVLSILSTNLLIFSNLWVIFHLLWLFSFSSYLQKSLNNKKFIKWKSVYNSFVLTFMIILLFMPILLSIDMFKNMVIGIGLLTLLGITIIVLISAKTLNLLYNNNHFFFKRSFMLVFSIRRMDYST